MLKVEHLTKVYASGLAGGGIRDARSVQGHVSRQRDEAFQHGRRGAAVCDGAAADDTKPARVSGYYPGSSGRGGGRWLKRSDGFNALWTKIKANRKSAGLFRSVRG